MKIENRGAMDGPPRSSNVETVGRLPLWPAYSMEEIEAVAEVLRSGKVNYWTGDEARRFESEFADYVGSAHAVALCNGTVALELALYALRIGPGDEVIVTPRTFMASASSIVSRGATPVFADVDAESQNISAETILRCLTPHTRAILVVHLAGWPCDMGSIMALARARNVRVIEDCAQAHGARYEGRPVGSMGDAAAFSFCQDKIMSTGGEGGMLVTNDKTVWERAWAYKDHGKSYHAVYRPVPSSGSVFRWLHESFGTNWRMTEMQAAIGRLQLKRLDDWVRTRRTNAAILIDRLSLVSALRVPVPGEEFVHAYYKFYAFVRPDRLEPGWDRDRIVSAIAAEGVPCGSGTCGEVYREKAFVDAGLAPDNSLPVAHELAETSLMLPVHPTLGREDMNRIAATVEKVMTMASA